MRKVASFGPMRGGFIRILFYEDGDFVRSYSIAGRGGVLHAKALQRLGYAIRGWFDSHVKAWELEKGIE
jgi:hypothetical protein